MSQPAKGMTPREFKHWFGGYIENLSKLTPHVQRIAEMVEAMQTDPPIANNPVHGLGAPNGRKPDLQEGE